MRGRRDKWRGKRTRMRRPLETLTVSSCRSNSRGPRRRCARPRCRSTTPPDWTTGPARRAAAGRPPSRSESGAGRNRCVRGCGPAGTIRPTAPHLVEAINVIRNDSRSSPHRDDEKSGEHGKQSRAPSTGTVCKRKHGSESSSNKSRSVSIDQLTTRQSGENTANNRRRMHKRSCSTKHQNESPMRCRFASQSSKDADVPADRSHTFRFNFTTNQGKKERAQML